MLNLSPTGSAILSERIRSAEAHLSIRPGFQISLTDMSLCKHALLQSRDCGSCASFRSLVLGFRSVYALHAPTLFCYPCESTCWFLGWFHLPREQMLDDLPSEHTLDVLHMRSASSGLNPAGSALLGAGERGDMAGCREMAVDIRD